MDRNIASRQLPATEPPSLSARRAWIEMQVFQRIAKPFRSLSARRAWIEIVSDSLPALKLIAVALRKESVDRNNTVQIVIVIVNAVALRKESVDRNKIVYRRGFQVCVALRKESVDRNIQT